MTATLTVRDADDRDLLIGSLQSAHTQTLDALASRVRTGADLMPCLLQRQRIKRMCRELGHEIDDRYRMKHIEEYRRRLGHIERYRQGLGVRP